MSLSSKKFNGNLIPVPDEIMNEILTRVPAKSLSRFKCVSKPWFSLISSERFVKNHLLHFKSKFPRIMLILAIPHHHHSKHYSLNSLINNSNSEEEDEEEELINIYFPGELRMHRYVWVIGSCNGLVCFSISQDLYLLNPCTRKCKKLPYIDGEMSNWLGQKHQFVYTEVDDDYKVFCFYTKKGELQANIYSWRADSWITQVCVKASVTLNYEQKFVAGKVHFGTRGPGLDLDVRDPILFDIVSFDIETGFYGTIEQPDYGDMVERLYMEELNGCLCVVCKKKNHADLWVMKEYGNKGSWIKMLTVSFLNKSRLVNPLTILPSGEVLMVFKSTFEIFNLKDKSSRVLNSNKFDDFLAANLYVESLVSPTQHERMEIQEDH